MRLPVPLSPTLAGGLLLACVLGTPLASPANLIVNGAFENPVLAGNQEIGLAAGTTSLPGWTVSPSVGLYSATYAAQYTLNADMTQLIDLTGQNAGNGTLTQAFATTVGQTYRVTVDNYNYGAATAAAITGGKAFSIQATGNTATGYFTTYRVETTVTYDFVAAATSTTLTLKDLSGFDSNAAWIDNVTVNLIPEFSHWALFASFGLLVLGAPAGRRTLGRWFPTVACLAGVC